MPDEHRRGVANGACKEDLPYLAREESIFARAPLMHAVTALEPMPDLHDGERTLYNLWRVGGRIAVCGLYRCRAPRLCVAWPSPMFNIVVFAGATKRTGRPHERDDIGELRGLGQSPGGEPHPSPPTFIKGYK